MHLASSSQHVWRSPCSHHCSCRICQQSTSVLQPLSSPLLLLCQLSSTAAYPCRRRKCDSPQTRSLPAQPCLRLPLVRSVDKDDRTQDCAGILHHQQQAIQMTIGGILQHCSYGSPTFTSSGSNRSGIETELLTGNNDECVHGRNLAYDDVSSSATSPCHRGPSQTAMYAPMTVVPPIPTKQQMTSRRRVIWLLDQFSNHVDQRVGERPTIPNPAPKANALLSAVDCSWRCS